MSTKTIPASYSLTQIALHWLIAALVIFQLVVAEAMEEISEAAEHGGSVSASDALLGNLHIWIGFSILALTLWRLALKVTRGARHEPKGGRIALVLMRATHALFYFLLIAAPVTGAITWYFGLEFVGEIHEKSKPAFIALIVLHVAATIWHDVMLKDRVMARMLPKRG